MSNDSLDYEITSLSVDSHGYYRDQNNFLVHRSLAFRLVYLPNRKKYIMPFKFYQVHHKDRNKKNNLPHNLLILTKDEHNFLHWVCENCNRLHLCKDYYDHGYVCPKGMNPETWVYHREMNNLKRK